jgi:glycosyltransferase involved in cell wall biosynthesis
MKNITNQLVSIIIPCFNEENTIEKLLEAIRLQSVPLDSLEVIIADGLSTDKTRQKIADFIEMNPGLKIAIIDNEKKVIPAGLNKAIKTAKGEIILRMDAHAYPAPDYVEKSVAALTAGLGDNVGGVIDICPSRDHWIARSISVATAHPRGVGDAKYRWTTKAGLTDTVAFGCFFKTTVEKAGYYNEILTANEDYEFNARLRNMGLKIWVDPAIRAVYFSRPDLKSLAKQYYSYGFWKVRMLRMYPNTIRWRQALPPLFVFGLLMLLLLSIIWFPAFWIFAIAFLLYLLILGTGALKPAIKQKDPALVIGIPLAIMTMHFSWGTGFWMSLLKPGIKEK